MRISDWSSDVCSSDLLPFENQWSAAQFKWYQLPGACAPASYTDALDTTPVGPAVGEPKLMNITKSDAHVSFKELAGGQVYCFGLPETDLSTETDIALGEFLHADDQDRSEEHPSELPSL